MLKREIIKDKTIGEILETLDRITQDPDELEHQTMAIETTAKNINKDKDDKKIQFDLQQS